MVKTQTIKPFLVEVDTDDAKKISIIKRKLNQVIRKGQNIFMPLGSVKVTPLIIPLISHQEQEKLIKNLNWFLDVFKIALIIYVFKIALIIYVFIWFGILVYSFF